MLEHPQLPADDAGVISAKFVPATSKNATITHDVVASNGSMERASEDQLAVAIAASECGVGLNSVIRRSTPVQPSVGEHDDLERRDRDVDQQKAPGGLADRRRPRQLRPGMSVLNSAWRNSTMIPTPPMQVVNWRHIAIERVSPRDVSQRDRLAVPKRGRGRKQERRAEVLHERADEVGRAADVDAERAPDRRREGLLVVMGGPRLAA